MKVENRNETSSWLVNVGLEGDLGRLVFGKHCY